MKSLSLMPYMIILLLLSTAVYATSYQWIEITPDNRSQVRVITESAQCPVVMADNKKLAMKVRANKNKNFPVLVCQLTLPKGTKQVSVNKQPLNLPPKTMKRIVIIGDTGCRVSVKPDKAMVQDCNDPEKWPLKKIANTIKKYKPQLIIHVGDFYYRTSPCPANNTKCKGNPYGDNWKTWQTEFFAPMASALPTAPWIITRGDREQCVKKGGDENAHGGAGWFRLLNPYDSIHCIAYQPLYKIPFSNITLAMIDSSVLDRYTKKEMPEDNLYAMEQAHKDFMKLKAENLWVVSHDPMWLISPTTKQRLETKEEYMTAFYEIFGASLPKTVKLILSGDIHNLHYLNFKTARAPQIVSGNGGTKLHKKDRGALLSGDIKASEVQRWTVIKKHGFTLLTHEKNDWKVQAIDVNGGVIKTCLYTNEKLNCD